MARKSRREFEQALEKLQTSQAGFRSDTAEGVTADFVTYEDGGPNTETAPSGWTWSEEGGEDNGEATYHVLTRESNSNCGGNRGGNGAN